MTGSYMNIIISILSTCQGTKAEFTVVQSLIRDPPPSGCHRWWSPFWLLFGEAKSNKQPIGRYIFQEETI